jgi:hypothetical protein
MHRMPHVIIARYTNMLLKTCGLLTSQRLHLGRLSKEQPSNGEPSSRTCKSFVFLTARNVEADELHILHLGVSQYYLGCVLWVLTYKRLSKTPGENIKEVWIRILDEYKKCETSEQFTSLGISSFVEAHKRRDQFPRLKGRGCEVKGLVGPLHKVWNHYAENTLYDKQVSACLAHLEGLNTILDEHRGDAFFSSVSASKFLHSTNKFLIGYSWLGHESDKCGELLFSAVPKLHWMWHMAWRAQFLNPRRVATFIDEDFVKHMKHLAASCAAGTALHIVPHKLMGKYRWALGLENESL